MSTFSIFSSNQIFLIILILAFLVVLWFELSGKKIIKKADDETESEDEVDGEEKDNESEDEVDGEEKDNESEDEVDEGEECVCKICKDANKDCEDECGECGDDVCNDCCFYFENVSANICKDCIDEMYPREREVVEKVVEKVVEVPKEVVKVVGFSEPIL